MDIQSVGLFPRVSQQNVFLFLWESWIRREVGAANGSMTGS